MPTDLPTGTLLSTRTIHDGRVFSVHADRVRLPNDRVADLEVVRHAPSVIVVPMPDPDHVILIRQYRHPVSAWLWEVPAGSVDAGEDAEAAAIRECHEEIGLVPARVTRLGEFLPTPGYCDEAMTFFRAEDLGQGGHPAAQDPDELIEVHTFTLAEALAMIRRGEMPDLKSAMAVTLVGERRGDGSDSP